METYTPPSFVAWGDDFLLFPRINIRSVSRTSVTHLCPTYSRTVRFAIVRNGPSPSTDSQLPLHLFCFVQFFEFQRPLLFRPLSPFNLVPRDTFSLERVYKNSSAFSFHKSSQQSRSSRRLYSNFPAERDRGRREGDKKEREGEVSFNSLIITVFITMLCSRVYKIRVIKLRMFDEKMRVDMQKSRKYSNRVSHYFDLPFDNNLG